MRSNRLLACTCTLLAMQAGLSSTLTAQAQKADSQYAAVPTIQAYSRLTVVDVTVTDSKGQPIQGLKASDFHIEDDGKNQQVRSFEEMRGDIARPTRTPPTLPPNVYTNLQPPPNSSSVNVLLLDALNTKLTDQAFVKSQTLEYLKHMTPGTRVAIFTLSSQLRILQGFTEDASVLAAALRSKNARQLPSPLLNEDLADSNTSLADMVDASTAASLQQFTADQQAFQADIRNRMTLEALNQIAAYLATIPGRKNLIWFTSGAPLQIFPNGSSNDLALMTDYTRDLRKTTDLLAAAQIAVYPVDARGVFGNPANSAVHGGHVSSAAGAAAVAQQNLSFLERTGQEQLSMEAVAEATGGIAYYNTNGLNEAVAKAVANGANYYTLSYTPANFAYDGSFHKIHISVDVHGAHLSYRNGYYADDLAANSFAGDTAAPAAPAPEPYGNNMEASMRRGVPDSSQILFDVRVQPHSESMNPPGTTPLGALNAKLKDKPLRRYDVQYIFPGRQIGFTSAANHTHHGGLDFEVAAYDVYGNVLTSLSQTIELPLSDDAYTKLQHSPFQFFQQLDLPQGDIFLKIGIHDRTTDKIGTLEIPVSVSKNSSSLTVNERQGKP